MLFECMFPSYLRNAPQHTHSTRNFGDYELDIRSNITRAQQFSTKRLIGLQVGDNSRQNATTAPVHWSRVAAAAPPTESLLRRHPCRSPRRRQTQKRSSRRNRGSCLDLE